MHPETARAAARHEKMHAGRRDARPDLRLDMAFPAASFEKR
jgi:hypothetical protein